MKKVKELPRWISITGSILLFGTMGSLAYYNGVYAKKKIKENRKITIATTISTDRTLKSGSWIKYKFTVNDIDYTGSKRKDDRIEVIVPAGRYYVAYANDNPEFNELIPEKPVPDSIKAAPPGGWDRIPGEK